MTIAQCDWQTDDGSVRILTGDCIERMSDLPDASVNCCVTSPPYWGLRDYGHDGQIGLEKTPEEYVDRMVEVFREVRRVLRDDGTLWLNLGDSYASSGVGGGQGKTGLMLGGVDGCVRSLANKQGRAPTPSGLKPKDLCGIPWRVAFAIQADGWYLRQDIIWHKPNPMPESVTDRCTKSHEYIFLLSKSARYFYDAEAVKEAGTWQACGKTKPTKAARSGEERHRTATNLHNIAAAEFRNRRSVWTVATKPYSGAHFATFPSDLIEPCILAGCPEGGTVLDPFSGSGTTGEVAVKHGRRYVGCELNPAYVSLALDRLRGELSKTALIEPARTLKQRSLIE